MNLKLFVYIDIGFWVNVVIKGKACIYYMLVIIMTLVHNTTYIIPLLFIPTEDFPIQYDSV